LLHRISLGNMTILHFVAFTNLFIFEISNFISLNIFSFSIAQAHYLFKSNQIRHVRTAYRPLALCLRMKPLNTAYQKGTHMHVSYILFVACFAPIPKCPHSKVISHQFVKCSKPLRHHYIKNRSVY